MAEPSKTLRQVLLASISPLTVTRVDPSGADGVTVDAGVLATAGLLAGEKVDLLNGTSGARLSTVVRVSQKAPGAVEVGGPAAHFVSVGDTVSLCAWGWMKEKAAARHVERIVQVDGKNKVLAPRAIGSSEAPPKARRGA